MTLLQVRAFLKLAEFDRLRAKGNFERLHEKVRSFPTEPKHAPLARISEICDAVDVACIWYWKTVLCLQRSAATCCLLRQSGVPAEMVIGTMPFPFHAHAWVEIEGRVVNDKVSVVAQYVVLARC